MPASKNLALSLLPVLFAAAASVACGESTSASDRSSPAGDGESRGSGNSGAAPGEDTGAAPDQGSAERAVAEADIVQISGGRLYAMSKSGSLSIVDVSRTGRLALLGQVWLPGVPFEMYLRGDLLVAMTNRAYSVTGAVNEPSDGAGSGETRGSGAPAPSYEDPKAGAGVVVIDVKDPKRLRRVATFPVAGEIADSRIVGDILYLATYETPSCYRCGTTPRTLVTTFDLSSPTELRQVDQVAFESAPQYAAGWGANGWKRSVFATAERLYVGGHADVTPSYDQGGAPEGVIDVVDITDPAGRLRKGAHLETKGAILSRWQMDENDGVLRVISQRGVGYTQNGIGSPEVQTFHIWNTGSMQPMGKTSLTLPRQEGLKSVRFDGARAYAITFNQTDPLFVIDLSNEAAPRQRGELHMPGWVFHLEPRGDRVLGLGLDRTDASGNLNVSLFDVADMDHPKMLGRVAFGSTSYNSDHGIVSYELPEDQDRIQKAFRVFDDGLVVVPFSGSFLVDGVSSTSRATTACERQGGGVQLIEWQQDSLTKKATLPVAGNPRRALLNQGELIAVSDSNVTSFDIARRDVALETADLVIGSCETRAIPAGHRPAMGDDRANYYGDDHGWHVHHCSLSAAGASSRGPNGWAGIAIGVAVGAWAARRRRKG